MDFLNPIVGRRRAARTTAPGRKNKTKKHCDVHRVDRFSDEVVKMGRKANVFFRCFVCYFFECHMSYLVLTSRWRYDLCDNITEMEELTRFISQHILSCAADVH